MPLKAAKAAFEVIKSKMPSGGTTDKPPFVIATVKGDIHDIGKNIVKLLLENYGFAVCGGDLRMGYILPPLISAFCWDRTVNRWLQPVFAGFWHFLHLLKSNLMPYYVLY